MRLFKIKLVPSSRTLHIFIGAFDEKVFLKSFKNLVETKKQYDGWFAAQVSLDGIIQPIIWLEANSDEVRVHEIVHLVTWLMDCLDIEDDEFRAYYTAFLFEEIKHIGD